ncbi:chondroitinase family polysaccharide lyase [Muricauda sp. ANG21]|uniref:chondroitinase family polysaccharide lyase n=1 Tax=Allomuricauda sp. ANG21 TaxID=3042468 RepID=UPI0034558165
MKTPKKTNSSLILICCFIITTSVFGQESLPFSQQFETGLDDWTQVSVAGNSTWIQNTYSGNGYADFKSSSETNEDWLVSPQIDLSTDQNIKIAFQLLYRYGTDTANQLQLMVSTNYSGSVSASTWEELVYDLPSPAASWNDPYSTSGWVDLSDYKNQLVHIAFKATSDGSANATRNWRLDNIEISEMAALPHSEDFEGGSLGDWTSVQVSGGASVWEYRLDGTYGQFARINTNQNHGSDTENWLVSPPLDMETLDNVSLSFLSAHKWGTDASNDMTLWVTTNYSGDVTTTSWVELAYTEPSTSDYQRYSSGSIDLNAYKGSGTRIAFKATSDGSSNATRNFHIDDINITTSQYVASLPYSESFEDGSLGHWAPLDQEGVNFWYHNSDSFGNYAKITGNKDEGISSKDWLISPAIDLDEPYDSELIFDSARKYGTDNSNRLSLWISTNYNGDMYEAIWQELTFTAPSTNDYSWYSSGFIDLSAFKGNIVHIAFKASSDGSNNATRNFHVDNINVKEKPTLHQLTHLQNFESGSLGQWESVRTSGNVTYNEWYYNAPTGHKFAKIQGNKDEGVVSENWLISPLLDLNVGQASTLDFQMAQQYGTDNATTFSVLISQDYEGDVNAATWTSLGFTEPATNDFIFYHSGLIDLDAFHGERVHIAFKTTHDGSTNATRNYYVDDIQIKEKPFIINPPYKDEFDKGHIGYWSTANINATVNEWEYHTYGFPQIQGNSTTASENWLISPMVNLDITDSIALKFVSAYKDGDDVSNDLSLHISTNYAGNVSTATWAPLSFSEPSEGDISWVESGIIDLSAYHGQTVNIGFKATANGTGNALRTYMVDDIEFLTLTQASGGPNILETSVPSNWTTTSGSSLSMSNDHFKKGSQSLKWDWQQGAEITVGNPENISAGVDGLRGGMVLWVYNSVPNNDQLAFEYESNTQVEYEFTFNLAFEGWRAIWVRFDEDMSGPKANDDLINMKIKAPDSVSAGTLYFDKIEFGEFGKNSAAGYGGMSARLLADYQMPFIDTDSTNQWLKLYHWDQLTPDIPLSPSVTTEEQNAFDLLETRYLDDYLAAAPSSEQISEAKNKFNEFNIVRNGNTITGAPLFAINDFVLESTSTSYDPSAFSLQRIHEIILTLAKDYKINGDTESKQMYLDLIEYFMDQGFAAGSAMGTLSHIGFSFRNIAFSIPLMKDELDAANLLEKLQNTALWITGMGELWETPQYVGADIDALNTTILPRFSVVLALDDTPEKARYLKGIQRWLNNALTNAPGTFDAFKTDGSTFHHHGFYPAYGIHGFNNAGALLYFLSGTTFAVDSAKHTNFNTALYAMNLYSNKQWGMAISGRHPLDGYGVLDVEKAYKYMALAGDPDSEDPVNDKFARAYVRLWGSTPEFTASPETIPNGNWSFNYGALGIHRWQQKMVTIKGYNKHVWAAELYQKENRYGRYLSYGTIQVIDSIGESGSGFVENGFDWNRIPGATIIYKSIDKLESPVKSSFLERSKEAFAGSVSFQGTYGAFGMVLRENDNVNYDENFTARKSVFSFDDRIICLGSNIRNNTLTSSTETVLFQGALPSTNTPTWVNSSTAITAFPYSQEIAEPADSWLLDAYGTGYYVRGDQTIHIKRSLQQSKHKDTKRFNEGNYSAAWLDHGTAPRNADYEYAILLDTDATGIQNFHTQMQDSVTALYKVYQKDSLAHIIKDVPTGIYGYSLFEPNSSIAHGDLLSTSHPALVMVKNTGNEMVVSMVNPDLNLPNDTGKGTPDASVLVKVILTIAGEWEANETPEKYSIVSNTTNTVIEFDCVEGLSVEANLIPKGSSSAKSAVYLPITLSNNTIHESKPIREIIGELSIANDSVTASKFKLIKNPGESFKIVGNKLITNKVLDFYISNELTIEVQAILKPTDKKSKPLIDSQVFTIKVLEEEPVETVPEEIERFIISPNPVENELLINYNPDNFKGVLKVDIFNLTGWLVFKTKIKKNQNTPILDLSMLPQGIYIVRLESGNTIETKKIIKK